LKYDPDMELPRAHDRVRRERADAARNRARILAAAERLLLERDGAEPTMEQLAAAAGVGKATLYRRFPDVPSVALALVGEHERALQERIVRGPPPLGPGASPAERLVAFYRATAELLEHHGRLALVAEAEGRRYRIGAYRAWQMHIAVLLEEAGLGDRPALVHALLAPLAADTFAHQRVAGCTLEQICADLATLARRVLGDGRAG
jgi:AcrR family transcriptional regulator